MKRNSSQGLTVFFTALLFVLLCQVFPCETASAPLYRRELNRIQNSGEGLGRFYEKLRSLKEGDPGRVTVLHIGDSHIQPDFVTRQIREPLQAYFGNAGRGLCFPYRLARTNGPGDYRITSNVSWESKRSVRTDNPLPVGVTGFTIRSSNEGARLDIGLSMEGCAPFGGSGFDSILVLHEKGGQAYDLSVNEPGGEGVNRNVGVNNAGDVGTRFVLPYTACHTTLAAIRTQGDQAYTQIYGISLERNNAGVLYHSAGVNGASFEHFSGSRYFSRHVEALKPDLVIVSLGTNSAFGKEFSEAAVLEQMDSLVRVILSVCPEAVLLLTTPPDALTARRKHVKSNVSRVRALMTAYCRKNNIPCWDLYGVMGGYGSVTKWRREKLVQSDMVHFTRSGYELQGKLFFDALLQGYRSHGSHRD